MSSQQGIARIALAALVIALLLVPVSLYTAYKTSKTAEELARTQAQALNETRVTIQELQDRIEELKRALETVNQSSTAQTQALVENITELASTLSTLQAQLSMLQESVGILNESLVSLNRSIQDLYDKLRALQSEASLLFPATIVDATGDAVVVPARPERIVSLAPSVTETLYYVNATDRIVGVDSYSDWPPEIRWAVENGTIAEIGGFWDPDVEKILSLDPDLVVGVENVPAHHQVKEILKAYGIPTILLPQETVWDVKDGLLMVGRATGNIVEATRAAASYESHILALKQAALKLNITRSVAIIVWLGPPTFVVGSGTFQGDGIELIGAENAFANMTGWAAVSPEDLAAAAPDVIILTGISLQDFREYVNSTLGNLSSQIPAIRDGRVYTITGEAQNLVNRPSPRFALGLLLLQYIVYPEIYNLTVEEIPHNISSLPDVTFPQP